MMSTFSCQCQNYRGNLVVTEKEFYFTSSLFRIELEWDNVKRVRLETKQVKGVPTSVLVVVLQHNEAIRLQSTTNSSQKKRGSASRKFFFYGFQDLLGAEELVKHYLEQHRAAQKVREKEGNEETDKCSSAATKRPEKVAGKDEVSSSDTEALKEESLNMSRVVVPRRPESEPSRPVAPLSFSGRRATASSFSRPKIPVKLLPATSVSAASEKRNRFAALFFKVYRHVALVLVLVMLFLLGRYMSRTVVTKDGRYATQSAERLLRGVDALAGATAKLESYDSQETLWRYNRGRKRVAELSDAYTRQLEHTAVELMERYVALQAKMATLRGRRATRVARAVQSGNSAPPPPPTMSSEFSTPRKATAAVRVTPKSEAAPAASPSSKTGSDDSAPRGSGCVGHGPCTKAAPWATKSVAKKKMSLSRLRADLQRWVRRGAAAWAFVSRLTGSDHADSSLFSSASPVSAERGSSSDEGWVVYTEELGDNFHLTEWVAAAEDEDRHTCLHLTKELMDTVELTERVFATFTSVFLVDRYRQLVSGEERGSYWLQPPQALRTLTNGQKSMANKAFSGDAMARMAMLRRFVASLVHNEPLVSKQANRRAVSLQIDAALVRYRQEEIALLRTRNRGHVDNTTELWKIMSDLILAPATKPLMDDPAIPASATYLRNSIEELRFWHTHESAWREHVLTFFTPGEQADIRNTFRSDEGERSLTDVSTKPDALHWRHLPLFRGLLCFEVVPELDEAEKTTGSTASQGKEDEDEKGGEEEEAGGDAAQASAEVDDDEVDSDTADARVAERAVLPTDTNALPATMRSTSKSSPSHAAKSTEPPAKSAMPRPSSASSLAAPSKSTDLWKEVKLRWMADLEAFRLAFDANLAGRTSRAARSYRLDVEDRSLVADAAEVRRRLFGLLALVNEDYVRYLSPHFFQRIGNFLRGLVPPYASSSRRGSDVYVSALQTWGTQDPAVQLATAQVTGLAPGTTCDVSGSLLYLILQPPPLLQTSMVSTRKTAAAAVVLVLFTILMAVLHFMQ